MPTPTPPASPSWGGAFKPGTPKIKICGLRDADSALIAADAGADYLGFVFVEKVRRQLLPPQGKAIIARFRHTWKHVQERQSPPKIVGLFRNQPASTVKQVLEQCGLDIVQLCGEEGHDYARSLGVQVLRQVRVRQSDTPSSLRERVTAALDAGEMVVLDRDDPLVPGGGGVAFDWRIAEGVADLPNVLLSGGLDPENVATAVGRVHPWGVDVSSGVETAGVKDPDKIRSFIARARETG
ncbi:MAG: phosphoribosylanthranilate isomerase [Chloroflexi bacterium]|nr:phosphoribosylanthranilate isomerase [Chloroflexota bacterium]